MTLAHMGRAAGAVSFLGLRRAPSGPYAIHSKELRFLRKGYASHRANKSVEKEGRDQRRVVSGPCPSNHPLPLTDKDTASAALLGCRGLRCPEYRENPALRACPG